MRRAPLRDFKREPLQARRRRAGVTRRWHTVDMAITTAIPPDVERPCIADGCGAVAVLTVGAGDPDAFDLCARCATAQERCVTAATLPGGGVAVTTATPGAALATNGIIVLAPARWISDDGAALPRPGHLGRRQRVHHRLDGHLPRRRRRRARHPPPHRRDRPNPPPGPGRHLGRPPRHPAAPRRALRRGEPLRCARYRRRPVAVVGAAARSARSARFHLLLSVDLLGQVSALGCCEGRWRASAGSVGAPRAREARRGPVKGVPVGPVRGPGG